MVPGHVPRSRRRYAHKRSCRSRHTGNGYLFLFAADQAVVEPTENLSCSRCDHISRDCLTLVSPGQRAKCRLSTLLLLGRALWPIYEPKFPSHGTLVLFYFGWHGRFFPVDFGASCCGETILEEESGRQNAFSDPLGCLAVSFLLCFEIQIAPLHFADLSRTIDVNSGGAREPAPEAPR